MYAAVFHEKSSPLALWLADGKGADVDTNFFDGQTPLLAAGSIEILDVLLERGADPTLSDEDSAPPLISHAYNGGTYIVARLLQDPRVRATVDAQDCGGWTALHFACTREDETLATSVVRILLQAGANPTLFNIDGRISLANLRRYRPTHNSTIASLEQALTEAKKTSLLVNTRRLVVAATTEATPSYLHGRVARSEPLPRVTLVPVTGGNKRAKKRHKFRSMLGFILGMRGGSKGQGMPQDVFRDVLMDLLMPGVGPAAAEAWRHRTATTCFIKTTDS